MAWRLVRYFRFIFLAAFVSACGSPRSSQIFSSERVPVIVISGGYASCEMIKDQRKLAKLRARGVLSAANVEDGEQSDIETLELGNAAKVTQMWKASGFANIANKSYSGHRPVFILSCYTAIEKNFSLDNIYFRYTEDTEFGDFEQIQIKTSEVNTDHFLESFFSHIQAQIDRLGKNVDLYILGHSYGGWTAIQTAHHFHRYVPVAGLVTLDPISFLKCKARNMFLDPIGTMTASHQGCNEAPTDRVAAAATQSLLTQDQPKFWLNIFQRQLRFLRSNAIPDLETIKNGYNVLYKYDPEDERVPTKLGGLLRDYHTYIGRDPELWTEMRRKYFSFVDNNQGEVK